MQSITSAKAPCRSRMFSSHSPSGSSYDGFGTSVGFDLRYTKSPSAVSVMLSIWTCCSLFRTAATAKDRVALVDTRAFGGRVIQRE